MWGGQVGGPYIILGERNNGPDSCSSRDSSRWSDPDGVWETLSGNMDWMWKGDNEDSGDFRSPWERSRFGERIKSSVLDVSTL